MVSIARFSLAQLRYPEVLSVRNEVAIERLAQVALAVVDRDDAANQVV
jgi:hypothetical protein